MKKVLSILLFVVNSFTFLIGLGFLFGDDDENDKGLKQD